MLLFIFSLLLIIDHHLLILVFALHFLFPSTYTRYIQQCTEKIVHRRREVGGIMADLVLALHSDMPCAKPTFQVRLARS